MIRVLEIAWLVIGLISAGVALFQFFTDGWQAAVWMLFVMSVSFIMYSIRRRQRIRMSRDSE